MNIDKMAEFLKPEFEKLGYVRLFYTCYGWIMTVYDPVAEAHYTEDIYDDVSLVTLLLREQEAQRRKKLNLDVDLEECEAAARIKAPGVLEELKRQFSDK